MLADERKELVEQVAQKVISKIALGNRVNDLADQAIARMVTQAASPEARPARSAGRKLILKCRLSPGDVLMLTAAVRDLHLTYPGLFITDVRTPCPQLWENNPYITPISSNDPGAETVECHYPLVHGSNHLPFHFIHAYRMFLNKHLGLQIHPHAFKGDVHLRQEEREWASQVEAISGVSSRYWIIVAGGKKDFTNKIWDPARFQEVVDHFRGRLTFVQVGQEHHIHPPLNGVISLVGKTDMRELTRLMYHADGVLCGVTMLMHLAAAVETKPGHPRNRPCVVVAGGREPSHWEAYPHHQFLHTNGALPCCDAGGCWKSRVAPLGDGLEQDSSLCLYPIALPSGAALPKCMDMITGHDVIRAIETYLMFDDVSADVVEKDIESRRRQPGPVRSAPALRRNRAANPAIKAVAA